MDSFMTVPILEVLFNIPGITRKGEIAISLASISLPFKRNTFVYQAYEKPAPIESYSTPRGPSPVILQAMALLLTPVKGDVCVCVLRNWQQLRSSFQKCNCYFCLSSFSVVCWDYGFDKVVNWTDDLLWVQYQYLKQEGKIARQEGGR